MSKDTEKEGDLVEDSTKPSDDPFELKKGASGVFLLIVVCSLFWILSKFGPSGANWVTRQTQSLFKLDPVAESPKETIDPPASEVALPVVSNPVAEEVPAAVVRTGNPKIDSAREQILEALGGSKKAIVKHVAISQDEKSMVAAVQFLGPSSSELVEIYFDKDNFGRYISTPDSPIEKEIKIWDLP